jgi:hypothetical protein
MRARNPKSALPLLLVARKKRDALRSHLSDNSWQPGEIVQRARATIARKTFDGDADNEALGPVLQDRLSRGSMRSMAARFFFWWRYSKASDATHVNKRPAANIAIATCIRAS